MMFTPNDWYWIVGGTGWQRATADSPFTGDETKVYSSARLTYVPPADAEYGVWKLRTGPMFGVDDPTNRIDTQENLAAVLSSYGIEAVFE